ncbi:MAG: Smr/MutS family protein, partial [Rhodanobacteraceae bacterium]
MPAMITHVTGFARYLVIDALTAATSCAREDCGTMINMGNKRKPRASQDISEADRQLFRDAVGPLRRTPALKPAPRNAPPPPRARMLENDESLVIHDLLATLDPAVMETGAELAWLRDGHSPQILKKLKRGHYSIGDELDLHHMTADAARASIRHFLDDAVDSGRGCVRIIHGKGRRSGPGGPVLKGLTDHLLRRNKRVLAFASAPPAEGGTGAVLV